MKRKATQKTRPRKIACDRTTKKLYQLALQARDHAHAPYSKFKVGAALLTQSGHLISGCNVENASYGGTICAERGAVCNAVTELGAEKAQIVQAVVVTDQTPPWPPCGFCRQVLLEFAPNPSKVIIYLANLTGIQASYTLADLLPHAFGSQDLKNTNLPRASSRKK